MTPNQKKILNAIRERGRLTKQEACELIPYYHNTEKHVGDVLTRMVRAGLIKRESRGVYVLGLGVRPEVKIEIQTDLFTDAHYTTEPK